MIQAMNFTDFLYRPRRPEELDTTKGGGVVFSQAAHQIDIVRLLAGGEVSSVYARTGNWDQQRPTEGAYTAILNFRSGAFASVTYNGYGFFDTDPWMDGIGEMGWPKNTNTHRLTRKKYLITEDEIGEARRKANRNFGGPDYEPALGNAPAAFQHFGPVVACCEQADLRLTPYGVEIHDIDGVHLDALPPQAVQRSEVVDEIWSVAREGMAPTHSGAWSMATMEVCLAILDSSKKGEAIILEHQAAVPAIRL
jgi:phthalate 4,5-cis-dihydrodiol dehydrogenase